MIDNLDPAITDITSELELLSMYVPIPNVTAPTFPTPVTVAPPQVTVNFVPPAENKRRLFSGNPADYKSFIDEHDASVGSQTMANVLKLQKLKERCDGEAYDAIKKFNTDAGYQEALAKLKQRFGSDAQAIAALRKQLYVPVKDKTDLLAVRKSFDDFECCLSKLDEYNQDIDSIEFKLALLRKLPDIIISKLSDFEMNGNQFVASGKYKLNIHLEDGTTLPVYPYGAANLVQRISVPKVPVEKYLRATNGKFPLPIKLGLPLLLLSMREYALLFIDEESKKLDNGFVLWQSKLGPFISGEGKVQRECIRSQSPLVSSITVENNLESNDTQVNLSSGNLRDITAIETEQDKGCFSTQKVDDSLSYNPACKSFC
uniref:Uncharacterized protein n=1 Tax=Panagrolaimus superbus TaxID=310955 RepID=A0A914Z3V2_9BILA